ncbi:helix-turn-helix transcriptional regulator [Nocardioides sp. GCM10027113]|uniref:helix-turn-helix transcriptional regulator n=1 Tax=unclassified Nocardioides TaxID=2615069 RepID=UPI003606B6E2
MTTTVEQPGWTFLTNHAHVLICIAGNGDLRISEIADRVGIGERATQSILNDLVEAGYLQKTKVGRRNRYDIDPERHLRHPLEAHHRIGELLGALAD